MKRSTNAIDPAVAARARELWAGGPAAGGLSFRSVVRALAQEGKTVSLATVHAHCAEPDEAPACAAAPPEGAPAPLAAASPALPLELADEVEAATEVDDIRAEALTQAGFALSQGDPRSADTLTKIAERMVKLSRLLRGRGGARGGPPAPGAIVQVNVLTAAEEAALRPLEAPRPPPG